MLTLDHLMSLEHELAGGDGDTYRRLLAPESLFVLPGMVLDADECARAMDASPGWDEFSTSAARLIPVGPDAAAVVYTFTGTRDGAVYRAHLASTYALRDGRARLVLHQQTPLPETPDGAGAGVPTDG